MPHVAGAPAGSVGSTTVAALVLAGGRASRMGGADKALVVVGGVTLLDRVLSAARPLAGTLAVAGPNRPTAVPGVVFRPDPGPAAGPVPPILALAGTCEEGSVLLVVAVDMALVTSADLARLIAPVAGGTALAAAALDDGGRANPLLAAYQVEYLCSTAASSGLGPGSAARLLLAGAGPDGVTLVSLRPGVTLNLNTPADLELAEALIAAAARGDQQSPPLGPPEP